MPMSAHAALVVTEIMYNPAGANTGRQWVEVTNTGTDSIDLAAKNVRLFDAGGNHLIKSDGSSSALLSIGATAVIAQDPTLFRADWPNYTGALLKSSFSLTSAGIVGFAHTDGTTLTNVSYSSDQGAANDGNSLQQPKGKPEGSFIAGTPTPGSYPTAPPAPIPAKVKPSPSKSSSTSRVTASSAKSPSKKSSQSTTRSSSSAYDSGTVAPAATANAATAGALSWPFAIPTFAAPSATFISELATSVWFAVCAALVSFSSFSLLVIQRHYKT
ncbi:lamin tail domain-containing protein [Patescibacteria group bacterium]|nr:lamin tail domain-containing protein [Patescibacteria group bacterium]